MTDAKDKVASLLAVLRKKIREQGFTLTQIQNALGWERGYLVKELNAKEALKVELVLQILDVIGVPPSEFFAEAFAWEKALAKRRAEELVQNLSPQELKKQRMLESLQCCVRDMILILTEKEIFADNQSEALLATLEAYLAA